RRRQHRDPAQPRGTGPCPEVTPSRRFRPGRPDRRRAARDAGPDPPPPARPRPRAPRPRPPEPDLRLLRRPTPPAARAASAGGTVRYASVRSGTPRRCTRPGGGTRRPRPPPLTRHQEARMEITQTQSGTQG